MRLCITNYEWYEIFEIYNVKSTQNDSPFYQHTVHRLFISKFMIWFYFIISIQKRTRVHRISVRFTSLSLFLALSDCYDSSGRNRWKMHMWNGTFIIIIVCSWLFHGFSFSGFYFSFSFCFLVCWKLRKSSRDKTSNKMSIWNVPTFVYICQMNARAIKCYKEFFKKTLFVVRSKIKDE